MTAPKIALMTRWARPTKVGITLCGLVALGLAPAGCNKSGGGTNAPGVVEGAANDIGTEIDGAGDSAQGVGDDVSGGVDDVVDGVDGSDDAPPPEAPAPDESGEEGRR